MLINKIYFFTFNSCTHQKHCKNLYSLDTSQNHKTYNDTSITGNITVLTPYIPPKQVQPTKIQLKTLFLNTKTFKTSFKTV